MTSPSSAPEPIDQARSPVTPEEAEKGIRDLLGLLALPALWAGRDGETVLRIMVEAIDSILPLQFTYVEAALHTEQAQFVLGRAGGCYLEEEELARWKKAQEQWKGVSAPDGKAFLAETPVGPCRFVRLSMRYGSHGDNIWFASDQPDFPTVTQLAYLRAAASLAASGLQAARASYEREQASRAKDEFLAMLGHELRNPLAPITTALELIRIRGGGELGREHQIIERQATHLSRLVDDLLDVTRITRGKIELRREMLDLRAVVARAIEDTGTLLDQRHHKLVINLPDEAIWVFGDSTRLTQVFSNLLSNAAKYTDPGGRITVEAELDNEQVMVAVRDNGTGISPQLTPHLFTLFEQGVTTIDRSKGGLGIGLALVKTFVELHEGSVAALSDGIGAGSEFLVRLPVHKQAAVAAVVERDAPRQVSRPMRVLVVDDNVDALESLQEYLCKRGHNVRITASSLDALRLMEEFQPEIAILDIGLPVMDGYRLAREFRKTYSPSSLRLIALTGYGQMKDMERSRAAGFDVHLVKPVLPNKLEDAMARN